MTFDLCDLIWPLINLRSTTGIYDENILHILELHDHSAYYVGVLYFWIFSETWPLNLTLWPQMTSDKKWSNNFCTGSPALSYTQVTWSCYIICRRSSDFSENNLFDPCDLGWPLTRSRVIRHMRAGSLTIVTKFHCNWSKQLEGTVGYLVDRRN